jgi:hypothetical protein
MIGVAVVVSVCMLSACGSSSGVETPQGTGQTLVERPSQPEATGETESEIAPPATTQPPTGTAEAKSSPDEPAPMGQGVPSVDCLRNSFTPDNGYLESEPLDGAVCAIWPQDRLPIPADKSMGPSHS